ncbi:LysR family transcriptional regulator [Stella sp.]|uniref:LysR family transcriptional regulator n=1 Tax=Stella sp. TaxID=2912054 RepID=UPI0035B0F6C6
MNLKALQTLVAIHDAQSFVEAARRLGLTQSAVSMQIKALERELGVALFDRAMRPPAMTAAAIAIVQPAREILALAAGIREAVQDRETLAGRLTLGAISTATIGLLPDGLIAIGRRYPGIRVRIEVGLSETLIRRVADGTLDAAIVTEPQDRPAGLRFERLLRERLALVSSPAAEAPPGPAALARQPFIRFDRRIGVGQVIDRYLARKGLVPDEFMELDSLEAILVMVERGLGIAIVPERSVADLPFRRLRVSPIDDPDAVRSVAFVYRERARTAPLLEAVLGALRQAAK